MLPNIMPPTEHTQQLDLKSLEDAIARLRLDINQYMNISPEVPLMQPMPPKEGSEKPILSPLEDALLHLRLNWPNANAYGKLYLEIALLQALKESRLDIVEELLEKAIRAKLWDGDEQTSLFHVTELGIQEIIASRLQQGASLDKQNEEGETLLFQASLAGNLKIMSLLLASGADIELADEEGWTPLMVAAERGHDEAVVLLLKHGASPNARDHNEITVLSHAAMMGYLGIVQRLLDAGADPNALDEAESLTALSWAAEYGQEDVVKLLLERGADPNLDDRVLLSALGGSEPDDMEDNDTLIEMLVRHGANVFMDAWSDERPLVIAARQGRCRTVNMFLEASYSSRSVRQEHIWDAITVAAEEGEEAILASLMKHCEMNEPTKWRWIQESQFDDSLELLRPYFEPDTTSENDGN
ncbi:ankyrin repeat domain-containing protein [Fusarium pseudoanthophilum]|uniref:Ankyrin repeat domain-containing protein n=1 Tax=Fusarium pseudoanthophilum TaxID=48495 RepID=A0A8H5NYH7_9HYPO|nr:ankyrin repeat domain-containing protein [Fusarium pseudoanthophilum]